MKRTLLVTGVALAAVIGVGWAIERVDAPPAARPIVLAGAAATASAAAATYDGLGAFDADGYRETPRARRMLDLAAAGSAGLLGGAAVAALDAPDAVVVGLGVGAGLAAFVVRTRSWFLRAAPAA